MRCEYSHQGRPCGREAVAYYINWRERETPICAGHLVMLLAWDSETETGPIGNLIHPDPAIAWQEKHAAATLEPAP